MNQSTSLRVFRAYMTRDANGVLDVSGAISRDCYEAWLKIKFCKDSDSESQKFYRVLTNHLAGSDGRKPFNIEEEEALLHLFRRKRSWPCFPPRLAYLGTRYRSRGHHEKKEEERNRLLAKTIVAPLLSVAAVPDSVSPPCHCFTPPPLACIDDMGANPLSSPQAQYLHDLGSKIMTNFSSSTFTFEDWKAVIQILRYLVLAHNSQLGGREQPVQTAHDLCNKFSKDNDMAMITVYDLTAREYGQHVLSQNPQSIDEAACGYGGSVVAEDLFGFVTAVGAAYFEPGKQFGVEGQRYWCEDGQIKAFDMSFFVDRVSMLLITSGKQCMLDTEFSL